MSNGNVKDLRISSLIKEIDGIKVAIRDIQEAIRKLSSNDEHTVRVFHLIQEKHNGMKDVIMKTLVKVTHMESELQHLMDEHSASSPNASPNPLSPDAAPLPENVVPISTLPVVVSDGDKPTS